MLRATWMGWTVVACWVMALPMAAAQPAELEPTDEGAPSEAEAEAHALFQAGRIAFEQGRYEVALERFGGAHELTGHAELLYNMGLAADRARLDDRAIELYERFLAEADPNAELRSAVEAQLTGLRRARERHRAEEEGAEAERQVPSPEQAARSAEEPEANETAAPPGATEPDAEDGGASPWLWVGVSGGVLAAGAAVVAAVLLTRDDGGPTAGDHGVVVTTLGAR